MKQILLPAIITLCIHVYASAQPTEKLPIWDPANDQPYGGDWLVQPVKTKAAVYRSADGKELILWNGLVKRAFSLQPDAVCFDYRNLTNGQQLLRSVKPEAAITINGTEYAIGGVSGQQENAYFLPAWLSKLHPGAAFHYQSLEVAPLRPFLRWKPVGWAGQKKNNEGIALVMHYNSALAALQGITVQVHYELYDGLPLIVKWVSVGNGSGAAVRIDRVKNEILGVTEEESAVVGKVGQMQVQHGIYLETNYAFNNAMRYDISDQTTHWKADSTYTSQVNYDLQTPCLLEIYPDKARGIELENGAVFNSVRTHELLIDDYDRERKGLAIRRMYRAVAPWTTENPIFMHLVSTSDDQVRTAVDQCAATGYEAVILSFGSHCDLEDTSAANITRWKGLANYAHSKGIRIGGYSLFSSRRISDEDDVIDPVTGQPDKSAFFGNAPCLGSKWGLAYLSKLKIFLAGAGFDIFENDGPYPGDVCASTLHPGHKGLDDSQWRQMELQKSLYHWCNEQGIYVNAPDWYFLDGTNKIAIGYREVNFSLPRDHQMILNRQNIFDGLWEKTPSMSWGFVPLTRYQGGGPEAVLEPLQEHLRDYEQLMMQYYGAGVQACYRGPRLYDTEQTRARVSEVVSWYKRYREILNSDILHLRRADGRDWDGWMHVNPSLGIKGLVMLFNPLKEPITRTIRLPLYYTGLTSQAMISEKGGPAKTYGLSRLFETEYRVTMAPESYTWLLVQ